MKDLYTIGHSTHTIDRFLGLLKMHEIEVVADVRSNPYSGYNPQFNREILRKELKKKDIAYVFLGRELGPQSEKPSCYIKGKVQYSLVAQTDLFKEGLARLRKGIQNYRIALMCAEKDPVTCHRMILICRALRLENIDIKHILEEGNLESLAQSERRLIEVLKMPQLQLFETENDLIERAYDTQAEKIAFVRKENSGNSSNFPKARLLKNDGKR